MLAFPIVSLLLLLGRGWLFGDTVRYKIMLLHVLWNTCRHLSEHYMTQVHRVMYFITTCPSSSQWLLGIDVYYVVAAMSLEEMAGEAVSKRLPKLVVALLCAAGTYLARPFLAVTLGGALQDVVQKKLAFAVMKISEGYLPDVYHAAQAVRGRQGKEATAVDAYLFHPLAPVHAPRLDEGTQAAHGAIGGSAKLTEETMSNALLAVLVIIHVISGLFMTSDFMVTVLTTACCGEALAMLEDSL